MACRGGGGAPDQSAAARRVAAQVLELDVEPRVAALSMVNALATARLFPPPWDGVPDLGLPVVDSVEQIGAVHQVLLGRQAGKRGDLGAYYTPDRIADFLGRFVCNIQDQRMSAVHPLDTVIVDPACGAGVLLVKAARMATERLIQLDAKTLGPNGYAHLPAEELRRGLLPLLAADVIYGLDIDPVAGALTKSALWLETDGTVPIGWLDRNIIEGDPLAGELPPALVDRYGGNPPYIVAGPTQLPQPSQLSLGENPTATQGDTL